MSDAAQASVDLAISLPTPEEVVALSQSSFGYALPAHQVAIFHRLVCDFLNNSRGLKVIDVEESPEEPEATDWKCKSPAAQGGVENDYGSREFTLLPATAANNPYGAWTLRCNLSKLYDDSDSTAHLPLRGKRVVIKDNIPIRDMPMFCGTSFAFTPHYDSPLVTRCCDAGAIIVGKAQCEFMCFSGSSHTASAGLVRNPLAVDYQAGGSSSGSAVLVASRDADLSIGCDQGGSCRIPSAATGLVACKPTHGLVPYTLIDGLYGPIDHAGPITRTVEDNALMLGVLAGWDGVDERASAEARKWEKVDYCAGLGMGVEGLRIGIVKEGFTAKNMEEDVAAACRDATNVLKEAGAEVEEVGVELHSMGGGIWTWYVLGEFVEQLFHADLDKKDDRSSFLRHQLLANVASWSVSFRMAVLAGEWLRQRYPDVAKAGKVYKQKLIESYEDALTKHDVLLMPTIPVKPKKLPKHLSSAADYEAATEELVAEHGHLALSMTANTMPINLTGHPAVSLPVGLGAIAEENVSLPLSVMLVGRYFQEHILYRVAYALEQARPWLSVVYHGQHRMLAS